MSFSGSFRSHCPGERRTTAYLSQHTPTPLQYSVVAGRSAGAVDKGEWTSTLAYSSAAARKKVYEQSIDVNEIFLAVWCLSHHSPPPRSRHPPRTDTHTQPACAHTVSRNTTRSSPAPRSLRPRPIRTSPGSRPSDMERPWRGALLFPSRGWRGACFPPLPFRTQTGMYLGQPGRGRTCQGPAVEKGVGGKGWR